MLPILIAELLFVFGREETSSPTYWIDCPVGWVGKRGRSVNDTREPLITLSCGSTEVTLHNFPLGSSRGIPPGAQAARWIGQLEGWEGDVVPTSHGGFTGLIIEGSGKRGGRPMGLIAAAFQLAESAERELRYEELSHEGPKSRQRLADVTIKAVGPVEEIQKEREAILSMIHSFQLVEEIP